MELERLLWGENEARVSVALCKMRPNVGLEEGADEGGTNERS